MRDFIVQNGKYILLALSCLELLCSSIVIVLSRLSSKHLKNAEKLISGIEDSEIISVFSMIVSELPSLINLAERSGSSGDVKKKMVLDGAMTIFKSCVSLKEEDLQAYYDVFSIAIENILSTPKKKETINEKDNG